MVKTLVFGECNHEGELDTYVWEVANSGGRIVEKRWNHKQRTGIVEIHTNHEEEWKVFMDRFKHKNSSFFLRNVR